MRYCFLGTLRNPLIVFGRDRSDIAKASLGAEKILPWRPIENIQEFIKEEKEMELFL